MQRIPEIFKITRVHIQQKEQKPYELKSNILHFKPSVNSEQTNDHSQDTPKNSTELLCFFPMVHIGNIPGNG